MDLGECIMALMKVLDKSTKKYINIKIDVDDLDRLNVYKYISDRNHIKPFREEKIEGFVRRIFLARDVMNFSLGDNRVVTYRNGDIFDCRKENLIEGRIAGQKSSADNFWPHTFKSLINFLDKRKGEDEEITANFLLKTIKIKYSRKRIDLIYSETDYNDYKNKNIQVVIMRVLHRYFEWGGQVVAAKDITKQMQQIEVKTKKIKIEDEHINVEDGNIKEVINEIIETEVKEVKEVVKEINLDFPTNFKRQSESNKQKLIELISKYVPIEDLLDIVMEKGSTSKMAMTVQFIRRSSI